MFRALTSSGHKPCITASGVSAYAARTRRRNDSGDAASAASAAAPGSRAETRAGHRPRSTIARDARDARRTARRLERIHLHARPSRPRASSRRRASSGASRARVHLEPRRREWTIDRSIDESRRARRPHTATARADTVHRVHRTRDVHRSSTSRASRREHSRARVDHSARSPRARPRRVRPTASRTRDAY